MPVHFDWSAGGGYLCWKDPVCVNGEKNKIKHKSLMTNEGEPVLVLARETRRAVLQREAADKHGVWLHVNVEMWAPMISVQPLKFLRLSLVIGGLVASGPHAGWRQDSGSGQTSCSRFIIYESLSQSSALVDFIEDVGSDASCRRLRTRLNK